MLRVRECVGGRVSMCVCTMYYSCCGDINLFRKSHCGDSPPLWGQNSSPHNVNHCILVWWLGLSVCECVCVCVFSVTPKFPLWGSIKDYLILSYLIFLVVCLSVFNHLLIVHVHLHVWLCVFLCMGVSRCFSRYMWKEPVKKPVSPHQHLVFASRCSFRESYRKLQMMWGRMLSLANISLQFTFYPLFLLGTTG